MNTTKASLNMVSSTDAVAEVRDYLNTKTTYMNPTGGLRYGINNHIATLVLHNFTGGLDNVT